MRTTPNPVMAYVVLACTGLFAVVYARSVQHAPLGEHLPLAGAALQCTTAWAWFRHDPTSRATEDAARGIKIVADQIVAGSK
jgi:hypothetical protein